MNRETADAQRTRLQQELEQLDRQAGLSQSEIEHAWSGAFIPYGALGDEIKEYTSSQNNVLYFDDEHDHTRRKVRQLYFQVSDRQLRQALIGKVRELGDNSRRRSREWVEESARALTVAKHKAASLPWGAAAVIGVLCVAAGYWVFRTVGAIAGAVCGIFLGLGHIANRRRERDAEIRQAEEALRMATEALSENLTRPDLFSFSEQHTGEEDKNFSMESAFMNRTAKYSAQKAD